MLKLDQTYYNTTSDDPGGPMVRFAEDELAHSSDRFLWASDDGAEEQDNPSVVEKVIRTISGILVLGLIIYLFYAFW